MLDITTLYCSVDDFWKSVKLHWQKKQIKPRKYHPWR